MLVPTVRFDVVKAEVLMDPVEIAGVEKAVEKKRIDPFVVMDWFGKNMPPPEISRLLQATVAQVTLREIIAESAVMEFEISSVENVPPPVAVRLERVVIEEGATIFPPIMKSLPTDAEPRVEKVPPTLTAAADMSPPMVVEPPIVVGPLTYRLP
jgi:hypothetical protein